MSEAHVVVDFPALPRRAFTQPGAVLLADRLEEVRPVIADAERAAKNGKWVVGFVAYEAAPAFDSAMHVHARSDLPLAWFAVFDDVASAPFTPGTTAPADWQLTSTRAQYSAAVEQIREEIASGRTYQVNLTTQMVATCGDDPFSLYESMRAAQGSGYHACIATDEFAIVSASPELFFEMHGRTIRARPMKGTRPRGRYGEEDARLSAELRASPKDRAENLMIVDLLRNDLGRVAEMGGVVVTSLYDVERYRTVLQLTSTIEATLRADVALAEVFAALFPCGSVTGAPKISTMQIITELEPAARGIYCGALGVIGPGGDCVFNVPIRTVCIDRRLQRAVYGTGAGITYDSNAAAEFAEVAAKAAVLEPWPQFELLETMRAEPEAIVRVDRHVARLLESARYFGFSVDEARIRAALADVSVEQPARLRLLVSERGEVRTELWPLSEPDAPMVTVARTAVSSQDRFLFHKTTYRRMYDERLIEGFWDVLLWNERAELTEFTRGNIVLQLDDQLLTPARDCGLLAGTFRAQLLEQGVLREAVIPLNALGRAARIWLINSVREWVPVAVDPTHLLKPTFSQ